MPDSKNNLKSEWSLLIHSFVSEESDLLKETSEKLRLQKLASPELQKIKRGFSQNKRNLNQKIEKLKALLELQQSKLTDLRLVGSDTTDVIAEIEKLTQQGEFISLELAETDRKIEKVRALESFSTTAASEPSNQPETVKT